MNTEQMEEMLKGLTLNEVTLLAKLAEEQRSKMLDTLVKQAESDFINAYRQFRGLAPNRTWYINWEHETNEGNWEEQDIDLYELLDIATECC